jgi:hypothetical protein
MAIEDTEVIVGVAALVAAAAALIFAIVQTGAALAHHVQVSSRCSPRVTGVFNLTAGFWFQLSSLSWNPQYRMPVLTIPGLREPHLTMESDAATADFRPGQNFDREKNGYVDCGRLRVAGSTCDNPKTVRNIDVVQTAIFTVMAGIWTPIGLALSAVLLPVCFTPAFCCGCVCSGACGPDPDLARSVAGGLISPLTFPWKRVVRYRTNVGATRNISSSPGLESATWCQFLVNFQDVWWGHANIRWEWRLATMIPLDVYGATIETTTADLRLLAAMGGMCASADPNIIARTRCGEMLTTSHHLVLGQIAYYRSGRENIRPTITRRVPTKTSQLLQCIMAVQNHLKNRSAVANIPSVRDSSSSREAVAALLSRPRTAFDAQIDCSLGSLMWVFSTETYKILSNGLQASDSGWAAEEARVFLGPLGQGIGSCSCLACCRQWMAETPSAFLPSVTLHVAREKGASFWPALALQGELETTSVTGVDGRTVKQLVKIVGPLASCVVVEEGLERFKGAYSQPVAIETLRVCRAGCADLARCACGTIGRVVKAPTAAPRKAPSTEEMFAAAAVNTKWLGKCSPCLLSQAAGSLAEWVSAPDQGDAELLRKVTGSLVAALPDSDVGAPDVHQVPSGIQPAVKANVNLVRAVMAVTEVYLLAVRRAIGASNMWNGPVTEGFDDFGPVVLGA